MVVAVVTVVVVILVVIIVKQLFLIGTMYSCCETVQLREVWIVIGGVIIGMIKNKGVLLLLM